MAADDDIEAAPLISNRSRKRKRLTPIAKLKPNQKVEVRSIEEGFEGSWHRATVVDCKNQSRVVKYDRIFSDDGSDNLVGSIPVLAHSFRGRIRLVPPRLNLNLKCLHYGQCVDVFHVDAWWEGVIFDHNDTCDERLVFFPDIGDELRAQVMNIRLTRDWNANTGVWKFRGDWVFLEVLEELELDWPILVSVKQIWYELRLKNNFKKEIKEWTCEIKEAWKEPVTEVILDNLKLTMVEFFGRLQPEGNQTLDITKEFLDCIVKIKPSFFSSFEVLPFDSNHSPVVHELDADNNNNNDDDGDDGDGDGDMDPPGFSKQDVVVSTDFEEQGYKWTLLHDFHVFDPEVVVGPECCPDVITEYSKMKSCNIRPPHELTLKVRQHLLSLGWKIEIKRDIFGGKVSIRYRYTNLSGKRYFSLNVICDELENKSSEYTSLESYKPAAAPPRRRQRQRQQQEIMNVDSDCGPQAVFDYISVTSEENGEWTKKDVDLKVYQVRAKNHLLAVGWLVKEVDVPRKRVVYEAPNGRKFCSLRKACHYYISKNSSQQADNCSDVNIESSEGGDDQRKSKHACEEKGVGKLIIKKKDGVLSIEVLAKRKETSLKSIDEETENSSRKPHVLRSSKRAREDISPTHQTPRTVLSWLIDNSVIVPRSRVQYRCRKDGHTMKEGRITREGIKCSCCQTVFSVSKFESHAGSTNRRPSANIFLEDGRSLLDCQLQLKKARLCKIESQKMKGSRRKILNENDYICSVCHYGGELVLCDQCPASFHTHCLGLKEVPDGDWFCPSCCCRICNHNKFSDCEQDTDNNILNCEQCERRYHIGCLKRKEGFLNLESAPQENWFCSMRCEEIYLGINKLLGKPIPVGRDDLTWTILKHSRPEGTDHDPSPMEEMTESYSKLNIAVSVMHECFEPVKEPRTQRDIVEDVIFCRWSELNRLNFKGFYTVLLEKDDELVSAATIRIYGEKVAELPLIGTRFRHRRRGMCHALMNVLENKLVELGVERLVLPAVPSVLQTWTSSFGFSVMTEAQKLDFLGYTFLDFQGTHMCQKRLVKGPSSAESSISRGKVYEKVNGSNVMDLDGISAVSEVSQAERVESVMVDQRSLDIFQGSLTNNHCDCARNCQVSQTNNDSISAPHEILANQASHVESQSEISVECTMEASNAKEDENGHMKCYHRRKIVSCES